MVFVTVSETYDLSTKPNKMSLIGIHTPSASIIQKTYPGLCMNSKYCRIVKQDVTMACASLLPADPLQVGVDSGDIAPQDMFNPILYKAVSNDSMSTLEARLFNLINIGAGSSGVTIAGESLIKTDEVTALDDDFNVYYALLSNRDGFKTASPQSGLSMHGLVPLVFEKYYNSGVNSTNGWENSTHDGNLTSPVVPTIGIAGDSLTITNRSVSSMRGRAHPMPRFNTTYLTNVSGGGSGVNGNGMGDAQPTNSQINMPSILPVYTAAIVMPPSKLNRLYYRMVVRTTLEFTEIRPITEVTSFSQMANYASSVYASDYDTQSASMTAKLGMVDTLDAEIQKIMEGA